VGYNLKQYYPYTIAPTIFLLFLSQWEPFNWPTINIIGTWATPQHRSRNMLMSLKYSHVLWCFPLALPPSQPMTFLFTSYIHEIEPYGIKKNEVHLEHLGNTSGTKKHPTHLRWTTFSSTLSEHFRECLTPMDTWKLHLILLLFSGVIVGDIILVNF